MKSLTRCAAAATSAFVMTVMFVSAQERRDQPQPTQPKPQPTQPAQPNTQRAPIDTRDPNQHASPVSQSSDRQLATCLILDNQGEISIAKFAAEKTRNNDVKEFANQMVKDHQALLQKLAQFAPNAPMLRESDAPATDNRVTTPAPRTNQDPNLPATANRNPNPLVTTNPPVANNQLPAPGVRVNAPIAAHEGIGTVDFLRIKQEIGQACVATMKKELGEKKGNEFDMCYMGSQIGAHLHMIDTLKVLKNYSSPQLRTVLEEGEKTASEHLDHAKQLVKDLEHKKGTELTSTNTDE